MKKLLLLLAPFLISAGNLDSVFINELVANGYAKSSIGFALIEKGSDEYTAELNRETQFIPASVEKLYTGAAALDLMSPLHDFKTDIYLDSIDRVTGEVIGNIYFKGHGDPGFTAEQMWLMAYHLKMEGITSLKDTLFVDNSYFSEETNGPGFGDKLSSRAYMAPVAPLSLNFNALAVHVRPTEPGSPAAITYLPPQFEQPSRGTISTIADGVSSGLNISTYEQSGETMVSLNGTINRSDASRTIYRKVWDPIQGFAAGFIASCEQVGITCSLTIAEGSIPDEISDEPFYTFSSQPLQRHVQSMFKYSNNFIAEMIFRSFHAEQSDEPGSWDGGSQAVTNWYKENCDTAQMPKIVNGSGMGSQNRCSPSSVISVLDYALDNPRWSAEFVTALPVAGEDGTLRSRFHDTPLHGTLRAKTGTLNSYGAINLAGYIFKESKTYLFVLFINDTEKGAYRHKQLQEKLLMALYPHL